MTQPNGMHWEPPPLLGSTPLSQTWNAMGLQPQDPNWSWSCPAMEQPPAPATIIRLQSEQRRAAQGITGRATPRCFGHMGTRNMGYGEDSFNGGTQAPAPPSHSGRRDRRCFPADGTIGGSAGKRCKESPLLIGRMLVPSSALLSMDAPIPPHCSPPTLGN